MNSRFALAVALGLLAGLASFANARSDAKSRDFGQVWYAARAVAHGQDPYALIGRGRAYDWNCRMFYPLPAAVVALPIAPLSAPVASGVFMAVAATAFAWALLQENHS